jgi:hypothetical protein
MRTTITLDPDTHELVQRLMRERGLTFKKAVNEAIRAGSRPPRSRGKFHTRTFDMGRPALPIDKALRLAADLEDEELLRRLSTRK